MFAVGVEVDEPAESIGRRSLAQTRGTSPTDDDVRQWCAAMSELLADVEVGRLYVYLDGLFLPADAEDVRFDGWAARHELRRLPHVVALTDPRVLDATIGNSEYWDARAIRSSIEK